MLLTVQSPLVTPDFGVQVTIFALVGVVVGGLDRLVDGHARRVRDRLRDLVRRRRAALVESVYLPSVIYGLVIVVLLLRPGGLFAGPARRRGARVRRRLDGCRTLLAPARLVLAAALVGSQSRRVASSSSTTRSSTSAIVVALYVFIGNSGVISFGHISFVAVGAYPPGVLTLGAEQKNFVLPTMSPFLRHTHVSTSPSLALAAAAGAVFALVVGVPLMRLSGLPAGIATFAVLGITYNVLSYWAEDRARRDRARARPGERHLDARRSGR